MKRVLPFACTFLFTITGSAQEMPDDPQMYAIIDSVSAERIEADIRTLAGYGTRHTMSDTTSDTRGIGAARR